MHTQCLKIQFDSHVKLLQSENESSRKPDWCTNRAEQQRNNGYIECNGFFMYCLWYYAECFIKKQTDEEQTCAKLGTW